MRTVEGPSDRVVVVGAGLGGLTAALHLAGAGRQVTVLERATVPGGRQGLLLDGGYRFDTGPGLLSMPQLLARPLHAVGEDLADRLTLHRLDPVYRARFADGSTLDVRADPEDTAEEIRALCGPDDAAGWLRWVDFARALQAVAAPRLIERADGSPWHRAGAPTALLAAMGALRHLGPKVAHYVRDPRLRALLVLPAGLAGARTAGAFTAPAVLSGLGCVDGGYFPDGGLHAVPAALAAAALRHGVDVRFATEVASVDVRHGRARGVLTTAGERLPADVVIAGERLVRGPAARRAPSAVVLSVGSTAELTDAHHTLDVGAEGVLLISTPTRSDPSLAPPGRHVHSALLPDDGTADLDRARAVLGRRGYDVADGVEVEHLTRTTGWAGPFRAPVLDPRVAGLVVTPAGTGLPLVLVSGGLAAQRVTGRLPR